ncbi:hypothetical protein AEA09_09975 [Lysinibacillus contaminans]|uniref:DUF2812 domain-containing protein n=1 Tax=Lysinibacillus contaminans TaxID=1293441 RepID=A0ABR5K2C9_9BACI|nr:DUF2812 domain-containing protein [Lysinibacillus contaminans]KOS68835.1 hypothetical protein AEA09_09975 [Lysinibacillus contaminans]
MKKIKFRFFIDHENEEEWVNDMAEQGWHLKKFWPFVHIFEKGNPGEYIYRNEMVIARKNDYFEFLEMMDVEHVHRFGIWSYYRKKRTDGPFDIYSDSKDKIRYLSQINRVLLGACILNVLIVILNMRYLFQLNEITKSHLTGISLNLFVTILCYIAIHKNSKRKKTLKETQILFEG